MEATGVDEGFRYWTTFGIPVGLILVTAFGRKLIQKVPFHWPHFYLGIELVLASLATGLINILDLGKTVPVVQARINHTTVYVGFGIVAYLGVLCIYQEREDPTHPATEVFWLGKASNLIGLGFLGGFVALKIKGIL